MSHEWTQVEVGYKARVECARCGALIKHAAYAPCLPTPTPSIEHPFFNEHVPMLRNSLRDRADEVSGIAKAKRELMAYRTECVLEGLNGKLSFPEFEIVYAQRVV